MTATHLEAEGGPALEAVVVRRASTGVVRVNLIPGEIAEARRLRLVQLATAAGVLVAAVAVGALYVQQVGAVHRAQSGLSSARAEKDRLVAEQQRLGDVTELYSKSDAATAMLSSAEAPQILWSRYLQDIKMTLPEKAWLSTVALTETLAPPVGAVSTPTAAGAAAASAAGSGAAAPATAGSPSPTPGARCSGVAGTLAVTGSGYTHKDAAQWLDQVSRLRAVTMPYLVTSTEVLVGNKVPTVTWSTSASLTCVALAASGKG